MKKILPAVGLVAAVAALGLVAPASASAAGSCTAKLVMPTKVTVDSPSKDYPISISTNCTNYTITAVVRSPHGTDLPFTFTPSHKTAGINVPNGVVPGTYTALKKSATATQSSIAWTNTTTVIKYASYAYAASTRSGSAVYVNGLFKEYTPDGLQRASGRTVYLQRYINGGWQTMLSRIAKADGSVAVGFIQTSVYQYRWTEADDAYTFGTTSGSTYR